MKKAATIPAARMSLNIVPVKDPFLESTLDFSLGLFLDFSFDFFLRKDFWEFISFMVLLSGVSTA
jgi:hypothetical protein